MSKNLTRKGLALGAVVALGTTLFASAPAQASSVLFAPTTGTGNSLIGGETFSLTASLSSDLQGSNANELKFKVTNTNGVVADVKINALHPTGQTLTPSSLGNTAIGAIWATAPDAGASKVFANQAFDESSPSRVQAIQITAGDRTHAANFAVTAWLDANNNGVVDSGELSASQSIHFVKAADAGALVTFTRPVQSNSALKATVSFNSDINLAQANAGPAYMVGFGLYNNSGEISATEGSGLVSTGLSTVSFDADKGNFVSASDNADSYPTAGQTFGAQFYYDGHAVGTESLQVVATSTDADATGLTPAVAVSDNVSDQGEGSFNVRTGTTSAAITQTIKKTTDGVLAAVGAGVEVKVTVDSLTLGHNTDSSINDTLSVAGKAVTSATRASFSATVYTDAKGKVSVPVVAGYGYENTAVTVRLAVVNAATSANGTAALTWVPATFDAHTGISELTTTATHTVVKGGTINLKYVAKDSYNALYTGSKYRLVVTTGSTGTDETDSTVYVPFVNGIADVAIADGSTAAGTDAVSVTTQKKSDSGVWANLTHTVDDTEVAYAASTVNIKVLAVAQVAATATAIVNTDDHKGSTSAAAKLLPIDIAGTYVTGNADINANTVSAPGSAGRDNSVAVTTISGYITEASGVGVSGALVTVSATGAQFSSGNAYGLGSLTVAADGNGQYTVSFATHTAGTNVVTVTSGAATKTVKVYVAPATATDGKYLTITAPATAQSGTTVNYSVVLTDKFGNVVRTGDGATGSGTETFSFSAKGVGSSTAAVTKAGVDGSAAGATTTQAADAGNLVITATYSDNGSDADTITATKTVVVSDLAKAAADAAAAAKAAADKAASAKTVTATPAVTSSQTGRAVDVSVKALNTAGTAAAGRTVTFTSTGAGSLTATSAVTDANGVATVKLVAGAADAGDGVVTATVDGVAATAATVTFGTTDAQIDIVGNRVTATASFTAGKTVAFYVDGIKAWSKLSAANSDLVINSNLKKGTHTVTVKISGGFVTTEKFIVK